MIVVLVALGALVISLARFFWRATNNLGARAAHFKQREAVELVSVDKMGESDHVTGWIDTVLAQPSVPVNVLQASAVLPAPSAHTLAVDIHRRCRRPGH